MASDLDRSRSPSRPRQRHSYPAAGRVRTRSSSRSLRQRFVEEVPRRPRSRVRQSTLRRSCWSKAWRVFRQLLGIGLAVFLPLVTWSYFTVIPHSEADPSWVLKSPIGLSHYDRLTNASSSVLKQYYLGPEMDRLTNSTNEIVKSIRAFSEGALSEGLDVQYHDFSVTLAYGRLLQKQLEDLQDRMDETKGILKLEVLVHGLADLYKFNSTRWHNQDIFARHNGSLSHVSDLLSGSWYSPHRDPLKIWKEYLESRITASHHIYNSTTLVIRQAMQYRETWESFSQSIAKDRVWAIEECKRLEQKKYMFFISRPKYCRIKEASWYDPAKIWEGEPHPLRLETMGIMGKYTELQSADYHFYNHLSRVEEALRKVKNLKEFQNMEDPRGIEVKTIPKDVEGFVADQAEAAMGKISKVIDDEKEFVRLRYMARGS